jgi:hypothetical protein
MRLSNKNFMIYVSNIEGIIHGQARSKPLGSSLPSFVNAGVLARRLWLSFIFQLDSRVNCPNLFFEGMYQSLFEVSLSSCILSFSLVFLDERLISVVIPRTQLNIRGKNP